MTNAKIFLDSYTLNSMSESRDEENIKFIKRLINTRNTIVVPNTFMDIRMFHKCVSGDIANHLWLEEQLKRKKIVIQICHDLDKMVSKKFLWSSIGVETPACESFDECLHKHIPQEHRVNMLTLAYMMLMYGKSKDKGEWEPGEYQPPELLLEQDAEILGISTSATRTEVLEKCKTKGRMDIFERFNLGYCKGIGLQHHCDGMLSMDCKLKPFF